MEIRRYILISSGDALVGNFGNMDSSLEITALGPPVNLLSRIDELTKTEVMSKLLDHGDLLIDQKAHDELKVIRCPIHLEPIDLESIGLSIRDFPDEKYLYRISPTEQNLDFITQMNESLNASYEKISKGIG